MKHFLHLALVAAALLTAANATGAEGHMRILGDNLSARVSVPKQAKGIKAAVLFDEDFSHFPSGTLTEPAEVIPLTEEMEMEELDPSLTNQPGWKGYGLYGVDGCALVRCENMLHPTTFTSPIADYSGAVTLTCRVRSAGEHFTGLTIAPMAHDLTYADTDINERGGMSFFSFNIYPKDGWVELTMTFDNYSSNNNGYIYFSVDEDLLISDIKLTAAPEFMAVPTMLQPTEIKEDGFTINWMPVRSSSDYYIHLYTFGGYDDKGAPILKKVWPAEYSQDDIDYYEQLIAQGLIDPAYAAYESAWKKFSYTFTGLDPEQEYYYCVQSHNIMTFSDLGAVYHAMVIPAPELKPASDIDQADGSYTANWKPVTKGDSYTVTNYGVYTMPEDVIDFSLLDEDFSGITSSATSLGDYEEAPENEDNNAILNESTTLPGWDVTYLCFANGKAGSWDPYVGELRTPGLYVANNDKIKLTLGIETPGAGSVIAMKFAGVEYQLHARNSYETIDVELPTNGYVEAPITFFAKDGFSPFLLDYIVVSQDLKKGSQVYVYESQQELPSGTSSATFTGLNFSDYDDYGFQVMAHHTYDDPVSGTTENCTSYYNGRLNVLHETAGAEKILLPVSDTEAVYYDLMGRRVANPDKGIYIKVQNGKSIKVAL